MKFGASTCLVLSCPPKNKIKFLLKEMNLSSARGRNMEKDSLSWEREKDFVVWD